MKLIMKTILRENLSKLAWLASFDISSHQITINHGANVECNTEWIVEGVWDDDFSLGNFHRAQNFFGSGVRIEGETIHFVTSTALVDRLIYCRYHDLILVSNSVLVLMAYTGARLDLAHDYTQESFEILKGTKKYQKEFTIKHAEINEFHQVYYNNFTVSSDGKITFIDEPDPVEFNSFEDYHKTIQQTLLKIQENYSSNARKFSISALATISSGYDSTAVTSLVSKIGVTDCFTSKKSNSILPEWMHPKATIDDGSPVANVLGLEVHFLDLPEIQEDELYFLAASCAGPELAFYKLTKYISSQCQVAVVFTGYHGDVIWDKKIKQGETGGDIIRGDTSGFSLSEIRLKSGFVNVAVPFMYANSIKDLVKISNSEEMSPWRLDTDYDRPVPRCIVEECGVQRHLFGFRKKGVTKYYNYPKNKALRAKFFDFIKEKFNVSRFSVYGYDFITNYPTIITMGILYVLGMGKLINKNDRSGLYYSRLMYLWSANLLAQTIAATLKWPAKNKETREA